MTTLYSEDEKVVYLYDHSSSHPDPAGKNVFASKKGEQYQFQVEKYWVITRILDDDRVEATSRSGTVHEIDRHDPRLRKATWWERIFKSKAFPERMKQQPAGEPCERRQQNCSASAAR